MSTKVTDEASQQSRGRDAGLRAAARRSQRSASPRSTLLFDDEHPEDEHSEDDHPGVSRLYTVAMMADVLRVPRAAVRHWLRGGLLEPVRRASSIEWFDFPQLVVGRQLVRLLAAGLSLREIDAQLAAIVPGGAAEAVRMADRIVTDGRRLSIRRDGSLMGAGGQLQLGFYTEGLPTTPDDPNASQAGGVAVAAVLHLEEPSDDDAGIPDSAAELLDLAADLEASGALTEAAEALRAVLQAQGPTAHVVFMLAELLYRGGDLTAARERYYAAVELDANHLAARSSLGCVLAELGDHELALAALDGVLRQQPDYADAHWHMAGVLRDVGREAAARRHLATFLTLAPESPWATLARERLEAAVAVGSDTEGR